MTKIFPNVDWDLTNANGHIASWDHVAIAVLMDIRRELRALNRKLDCPNVISAVHAIVRMDKRAAKEGGK